MLVSALSNALLVVALGVAPPSSEPRLVLVVVVDQLRLEEMHRLAPLLGPDGFGGLEARGTLLDARYNTVNTETGPGHATISTGAYANDHGVVANTMMFPEGRRYVVQDSSAPLWGVAEPKSGRSPRVLKVTTVGDQLKLASGGKSRVLSVTGKDRSALLTAGSAGDLALWWDGDLQRFVSSTFYAPQEPGWVRAFNDAHPPASLSAFTWEPHRPLAQFSAYTRADDAPGEGPRYGLGTSFPKVLSSPAVKPETVGQAVRITPKADSLVLEAAAAAARELGVCTDLAPDLMFVGLSGYDLIGHAYGPYSVERADSYVRLSQDLKAFLTDLEKRCPRDQMAIILTSDHGVSPLPEDAESLRIPSGRVRMNAVMQAVDAHLDATSGPNDWVALFSPPHLWLRPSLKGELGCEAIEAAARAARVPGVGRTVATCRLQTLANPVWLPFHHVVDEERSGHLLIEPKPHWLWDDGGTDTGGADHGTSFLTDQRVPLLIIAPPAYRIPQPWLDGPVDMRQLAPTLTTLLNVTPPSAAHQPSLLVKERRRK